MRSTTLNQENFASVIWDEATFKYCEFENFSKEGEVVSSDFISCSFKKIEWYWGIFTHAHFIKCRFTDCVFRGTSLVDARFVECTFENCRFTKDNLGSDCDFAHAIAYGCTVNNSEGFTPEIKN